MKTYTLPPVATLEPGIRNASRLLKPGHVVSIDGRTPCALTTDGAGRVLAGRTVLRDDQHPESLSPIKTLRVVELPRPLVGSTEYSHPNAVNHSIVPMTSGCVRCVDRRGDTIPDAVAYTTATMVEVDAVEARLLAGGELLARTRLHDGLVLLGRTTLGEERYIEPSEMVWSTVARSRHTRDIYLLNGSDDMAYHLGL